MMIFLNWLQQGIARCVSVYRYVVCQEGRIVPVKTVVLRTHAALTDIKRRSFWTVVTV